MGKSPTCQCKTPVPAGSLFCWSHGGRHAVAVFHAEQGHIHWHTEGCIGRAERLLAVTLGGIQMIVTAAEAVPPGRPNVLRLQLRDAARPTAKVEQVEVPLVTLFDAIQGDDEHLAVVRSAPAS